MSLTIEREEGREGEREEEKNRGREEEKEERTGNDYH